MNSFQSCIKINTFLLFSRCCFSCYSNLLTRIVMNFVFITHSKWRSGVKLINIFWENVIFQSRLNFLILASAHFTVRFCFFFSNLWEKTKAGPLKALMHWAEKIQNMYVIILINIKRLDMKWDWICSALKISNLNGVQNTSTWLSPTANVL